MRTLPLLPLMISGKVDWKDPGLVQVLGKLFKQGYTASVIIERLHDHFVVPKDVKVTRSAMCGALWRAGLTRAKPRQFNQRKGNGGSPGIVMKTRVSTIHVREARNDAKPDHVPQDPRFGHAVAYDNLSKAFNAANKPHDRPLINITKLNDNTCRWPFECDDGSTKYCGDHVLFGNRYCAYHAERSLGQLTAGAHRRAVDRAAKANRNYSRPFGI